MMSTGENFVHVMAQLSNCKVENTLCIGKFADSILVSVLDGLRDQHRFYHIRTEYCKQDAVFSLSITEIRSANRKPKLGLRASGVQAACMPSPRPR